MVIYCSKCFDCSPCFDSFNFVWKYMKGHVSFWTVKSIFGHHEHLWDGDSHKPPNLYLFSLSFIFFEPMMLLFCSAYQHLLSKSPTSCSSLQSTIFPFTCIPTSWYILMIKYYPINLGCLQFWFFLAQNMMDDNPIGSLWRPMPLLEKRMLMPVRFIV